MKEPYLDLVGAIIRQAVQDLSMSDKRPNARKYKQSAQVFLESELMDNYCELCNLNAQYIRAEIAKIMKKS